VVKIKGGVRMESTQVKKNRIFKKKTQYF